MHQPTPGQKAFLKLRLPESYAPVKQDVDALKQWLADAANASAATNPAESRKLLIGLEDPEQNTPLSRLQEIVHRCCEAVVLDRNNAAAHFMLARAITELGRFDEDTYHGQALRDASDFAETAKQLAPKVGKAWRAGIEILIRQGRHDIAYEQLGELQKLGIAPGTHATLMALWHERQGHWAEAAQYYEKAVTYATNNARRSELYTLEALAWINAGRKSDADRALLLGLLEGGEQPWIAHNWSVLKNELGNSWAAVELNRRALMWDPGFEAAQEFRDYLQNGFKELKRQWPGAQMLQEEQLRGIALPGCDAEIMVKNKLQSWSPPRRGERAKATRTFGTGLEEV